MRKRILIVVGGIIIATLGTALFLFGEFDRQVTIPPVDTIEDAGNLPLQLPDGYRIEVFAQNIPGARVIAGPDQLGNFWVSQTSQGTVSILETENGEVARVVPALQGLNRPHGLAFDPEDPFILYIAESDKIIRVRTYSDAPIEDVVDLPDGGRHSTRTLLFDPDHSNSSGQAGRLYVSIGSSCDVCYEDDPRRASIYSLNKDGSDFRQVASGLRNAVFMEIDPTDGALWATEMGRDFLGDDLPPDEVNVILGLPAQAGNGDYGWPICYGQNVHDTRFDRNIYVRNPCEDKIPPRIEIPAHSAPLGLAFVPEEGWPEDHRLDLLIAYHGSWNRSEPTGYKIVRAELDGDRNFAGLEDFITGWLTPDGSVIGRPVDILALPGGVMYITDDAAGFVYRVIYTGN